MKTVFALSVLLLVALLATGCATNGSVRRMIDENNAVYNERIGLLAVRVDDIAETQDNQKTNLLAYLKKQNQLLIDFIGQLEQKKAEEEAPIIENVAPTNSF